jgi:hypothetical protein
LEGGAISAQYAPPETFCRTSLLAYAPTAHTASFARYGCPCGGIHTLAQNLPKCSKAKKSYFADEI